MRSVALVFRYPARPSNHPLSCGRNENAGAWTICFPSWTDHDAPNAHEIALTAGGNRYQRHLEAESRIVGLGNV